MASKATETVDKIGDNQGKNLTSEGQSETLSGISNAVANKTVANSMGSGGYFNAKTQLHIESDFQASQRSEAITNTGGYNSTYGEGASQYAVGQTQAKENIASPTDMGYQSEMMSLGNLASGITRASQAGGGNTMEGARKLAAVDSSRTSQTLAAHGGAIEGVDNTAAVQAMASKGDAQGQQYVANKYDAGVDAIARTSSIGQHTPTGAAMEHYRNEGRLSDAAAAKTLMDIGS